MTRPWQDPPTPRLQAVDRAAAGRPATSRRADAARRRRAHPGDLASAM
ncbi:MULTISPECIES: hypothetical protein [unclassified Curtobacterium]|nr:MULTISPECIES: hypothetical protein [unclassified Curtobacterium]